MMKGQARMWCSTCREYHYGTSEKAVQDFIHTFCKNGGGL